MPARRFPLAKPLARASILVVCTANVCRSPLAQFVLTDTLRRTPGFESVQVSSVGTQPVKNGEVCELVRTTHSGVGWNEFVAKHRTHAATPFKIGQATLILTASVEMRGMIAAIDPGARSRTFTLREALLLGQDFDPAGLGPAAAVEAFAAHAHANRGIVPIQAPRRSLLHWGARDEDPLTIQDGHNGDRRQHRATIASVVETSTEIANLITGA